MAKTKPIDAAYLEDLMDRTSDLADELRDVVKAVDKQVPEIDDPKDRVTHETVSRLNSLIEAAARAAISIQMVDRINRQRRETDAKLAALKAKGVELP